MQPVVTEMSTLQIFAFSQVDHHPSVLLCLFGLGKILGCFYRMLYLHNPENTLSLLREKKRLRNNRTCSKQTFSLEI